MRSRRFSLGQTTRPLHNERSLEELWAISDALPNTGESVSFTNPGLVWISDGKLCVFSQKNNLRFPITISLLFLFFWHRCYLESESDKDMPAVMQLRLHFARFIYKMITSVPGEWKPYVCGWPRKAHNHNLSSWSKSSMRELLNAGYFHIFVVFHKEWHECKSAVLPVTSRTATVTESGELSMADVLTWVRKRRTVKAWASHELWPGPELLKRWLSLSTR